MSDFTGSAFRRETSDGTPIWLMEFAAPNSSHAAVFIAVDASDSFLPAHETTLRRFLHEFADKTLRPGDVCKLWLFCQKDPACEVALRGNDRASRSALARALADAVTLVRGGTWLASTTAAMTKEAESLLQRKDEYWEATLIVITDGEIFDRELVRFPLASGLKTIMVCPEEGQLEPLRYYGATVQIRLMFAPGVFETVRMDEPEWTVEISDWAGSSQAFLIKDEDTYLPISDARINAPYACDGKIRMVFCGGRPTLAFTFETKRGRIRLEPKYCARQETTRNESNDYICKRIEGLLLRWNFAALSLIAQNRSAQISCPACGRRYLIQSLQAGRQLYCTSCQAFLVTTGKALGKDPGLATKTYLFMTNEDSGVDAAPIVYKTVEEPPELAVRSSYDRISMAGREFLLLRPSEVVVF